MTELSELEGADRLVYLLDKRMREWEQADPRSRKEHEAAEGFTRLWAELKAHLADGGTLPRAWANAARPEATEEGGPIWPVKELLGGHTVAVPLDRKDSML